MSADSAVRPDRAGQADERAQRGIPISINVCSAMNTLFKK